MQRYDVNLFLREYLRVCKEIIWTLCCWPPGPLARRERRAIPGAVCEERATKPAGTAPRSPVGRSPEGRGGEGRVSALLPLLCDVRHRLRRGASHLPARRSRQSVHIISLQTLKPELRTRSGDVSRFRGEFSNRHFCRGRNPPVLVLNQGTYIPQVLQTAEQGD